jgi:hypothetical protein
LGLHVSIEDARNAELIFWPTFDDGTEPDLVLIVGTYYLLIESKYHSGFSQKTGRIEHQIVREVKGGKKQADNEGKIFKIVALTAHYSEKPEILKEIPDEYRKEVIWLNWQRISVLLYQCLENPSISLESRLFAEDLYALMVRKKLRNYAGTRLLPHFPFPLDWPPTKIFFDAVSSNYRGDFMGFSNTLAGFQIYIPVKIFYQHHHLFFNNLLQNSSFPSKSDAIFFRRK